MLCIGNIYAWSIIASELIDDFNFSATQSQVIFGTMVAVFPITMIYVGQLGTKIKARILGYISGILFFTGYMIASYSQGNFFVVWLGVGVFAGAALAFGYWTALTTSVQWFPENKGLITGIVAAGFGLGAVLMSIISGRVLASDRDVLELLRIVGIAYGIAIVLFSNFIIQKEDQSTEGEVVETTKVTDLMESPIFYKLFAGMFLGTFAGLLIIGSLKIIGGLNDVSNQTLLLGISLFAVANFLGRITWGFLSDHIGASLTIFFALLVQSIAILFLDLELTDMLYLVIASLIGFGFGGNFVLFAKETAQVYGVKSFGVIYPFVFLSYAFAGITGPISGGFLFDTYGSYSYAIFLASIISLAGSLLFLYNFIQMRRNKQRE
jgi:OFA family oxalate/formate antiporter-like MFS transporter